MCVFDKGWLILILFWIPWGLVCSILLDWSPGISVWNSFGFVGWCVLIYFTGFVGYGYLGGTDAEGLVWVADFAGLLWLRRLCVKFELLLVLFRGIYRFTLLFCCERFGLLISLLNVWYLV